MLSDFIDDRRHEILEAWDEVAGRMVPAADELTWTELRNNAAGLLDAVSLDLRATQTAEESAEKARGGMPGNSPDLTKNSREHAEQRLRHGFTLHQVLLEFRALRASVVSIFRNSVSGDRREILDEVTRFHEAIDQALIEAAGAFHEGQTEADNILKGVLAHDLRAPLNTASLTFGHFASIAYRHHSDPQLYQIEDRFRAAIANMSRLIQDLLDYCKVKAGATSLPIAKEDTDLGSLTGEVVDQVRLSERGAEIVVRADGDLRGRWDRDRLGQVLTNLLKNALDHGKPGAPIEVEVAGTDETVRLSVRNEGPAIPDELGASIFEPMHSGSSPPGQTRHAGLGLYIARQIVELHQGSIDFESSAEAGTTFTVELPRGLRPAPVWRAADVSGLDEAAES